MKLIAGLGNPGPKYAGNRHNIGYMAVDRIADSHGFGPWRRRFQGQVSEGRLGGDKVLLLKPETYMNLSGQSVGEAMRFYKLCPSDVIVIHDEIDLAPGKCRIKTGGGHAGHNGLRSIHAHIGADYHRVRLGVGHPGDKNRVPQFVLQDFAKADQDWLAPLLDGIADGAPALAQGDWARFQNAVALRVAPPRSSSVGNRGERSGPAGQTGRGKTATTGKTLRKGTHAARITGADRGPTTDKTARKAPPGGDNRAPLAVPKDPRADPSSERADAEPASDMRSALQKLIDRFSG